MSSPVARKLAAADARRIAAARAAHAATVSRRQAAARRRRLLIGVLLAIAVVLVILGSVTPVPMWTAVIPTLLAAGVGYLGFRAAQAARAADERWEAELIQIQRPLAQRTKPDPQRESAQSTAQASLRIDVDPASLFVEEEKPEEVAASTWTPVPVPVPTYTLKPSAPRRTVAAYEPAADSEISVEPVAPVISETPVAVEVPVVADIPAQPTPQPAATHDDSHGPSEPARTVDVREVLARRRAAG